MITTKDKIGYIRRNKDSDGKIYYKYIESKITAVRIGKTKTSIYSKNFYALNASELEFNTKLMSDNSELILVGEPFITNNNLSVRLKKVVDYWNEHGAKDIFGDKVDEV